MHIPSTTFQRGAALALAALLAGCERDPEREAAAATAASASASWADSAAGVLETPDEPYRVVPLTNPGRIVGVVEIEGEPPPDTIVRPTRDQRVCGEQLTDVTMQREGTRLGGVVVWLPGLREGKPLPLERRFEVTVDQCRYEPRVQAALVGGTVNVRNRDPVPQRSRFVRLGEGVVSLVRHLDAGEVVPNEEILARPGQVRVTSDAHPWARGWIFAFDQPYFDVTGRQGAFEIDSVPPGRYQLSAWHERFGLVTDSVTVPPGGTAEVTLRLRAGA